MDKAFIKVIRRDGLARSWAIIFCACCVLLAVTTLAQNSGSWLEYVRLILVLVATLTGVASILRAGTVTALLSGGRQVEGRVSEETSSAEMAPITHYTFLNNNERVRGRAFMAYGFKAGQSVTVCYDPKRPEVAVIRDIFL